MVEEYTKLYLELLLNDDVLKLKKNISDANEALLNRIGKFTKIEVGALELKNVAITYNNKVIELFHLYKNKQLDFVDSDVAPVILDYFRSLLEETIIHLAIIIAIINKIIDLDGLFLKRQLFRGKEKKELLNNFFLLESLIERINSIDDTIFDFSIERNFSELLEIEKDYLSKKESAFNPDKEYSNAVMHNIDVELGLLGYKNIKGIKYPLLTAEKIFVYENSVGFVISKRAKEFEIKYANYPYVLSALINHLSDYKYCIKDLFNDTSSVKVEQAFAKLESFDEIEAIVDALGKYIRLYNLEWDLENIKNELIALGFESKVEELVQKIDLGYYNYYPDYCYDKDDDNALILYEQLIENKNSEKAKEKSRN